MDPAAPSKEAPQAYSHFLFQGLIAAQHALTKWQKLFTEKSVLSSLAAVSYCVKLDSSISYHVKQKEEL